MKLLMFVFAGLGLMKASCQSNQNLQEEPLNLIKNGNFDNPAFSSTTKYMQYVTDWQSADVQGGKGVYFNDNWGNRYVMELSTYGRKNGYLKQILNLRQGIYILSFQYAPRKRQMDSSSMALVWNGRVVKNFHPTDESVRVFTLELIAINGNNSIEFRALGKEDAYAMAVSNVQIIPSSLLLYRNPQTGVLGWTAFNGNLISVPYVPGSLNSGTLLSASVPQVLSTLVNNNNFAAVPTGLTTSFDLDSVGGQLSNDFATWIHTLNYFNTQTNLQGIGNAPTSFIDSNGNILDLNGNQAGNVATISSGANYQDLVNGGTLINNGVVNQAKPAGFLNQIVNGRFIYPSISTSSSKRLTTLNYWQISNVELFSGYYHNKNWGNRFVLQLAGSSKVNGFIRQTIPNLRAGVYVLTFDYSARQKYIDSSGLMVVWNGQQIKDVLAFDDVVRTMRLQLTAANGQNVLQIKSLGKVDSVTMAVADIRLVPLIVSSYNSNNPISINNLFIGN